MNNPDYPAFPLPDVQYPNGDMQGGTSGLTKREHMRIEFAKAALIGLLTNPNGRISVELGFGVAAPHHIAKASVKVADAMIEAILKEK